MRSCLTRLDRFRGRQKLEPAYIDSVDPQLSPLTLGLEAVKP